MDPAFIVRGLVSVTPMRRQPRRGRLAEREAAKRVSLRVGRLLPFEREPAG
jgi:hypothetical protein